MPSTFTSRLRLELQATGENTDTWGERLNTVCELIEDALAGITTVNTTGGTSILTTANSDTDEARRAAIKVTGTLVSNAIIQIPAVSKVYIIINATSGDFTVSVKTSSGAAAVLGQGAIGIAFCDGTDTRLISGVAEGDVPTNVNNLTIINDLIVQGQTTLQDLTVQGDTIFDGGTVTFINGATIDLPDGTVTIDDLSQEVFDTLPQRVVVELNPEAGATLTADMFRTFHLKNCVILDAYICLGENVSSSGAVTMDVKRGAGAGTSIFDTLPSVQEGDSTSEEAGGTLAVINSVQKTVGASLVRFKATVTAAGTGVTGAKLYLHILGGSGVVYEAPSVPVAEGRSTGVIEMWGGSSAPTGAYLCDGSAKSRTTDADLFAVIGTTYGAGDGSTTFNVPNFPGRSPIGAGSGSGLTTRAEGDTGGAESVQLSATESGMPSHSHTGSTDAAASSGSVDIPKVAASGVGAWGVSNDDPIGGNESFDVSHSHSHTVTVNAAAAQAAAAAHNNMMPFLAVNFIIWR